MWRSGAGRVGSCEAVGLEGYVGWSGGVGLRVCWPRVVWIVWHDNNIIDLQCSVAQSALVLQGVGSRLMASISFSWAESSK